MSREHLRIIMWVTGSTEWLMVRLTFVLDLISTQWQLVGWICEGWHAKYSKQKILQTTNEHEIVWPIAQRLAKAINFQQYQSPGLSSTTQAELWLALSQSYELQLRHGSEVNSQPLIGNGGLGPAQSPQHTSSQAQQTGTQKQVLNVYCSTP